MQPEQALAASEDRYRRLVESCPDPIVVHSDGRIRFVNAAAVTLLGASGPAELLGRPIAEFVHPDFHAIVAERVHKMQETGEPAYLLEEKLLRLDGSVVEVEVAGAHVIFQGEPAIQLVGRDVTERKRLEAERRRLQDRMREARRRESLVAVAEGVAHQLAELSSTIVDTADQALTRDSEEDAGDAFLAIRRAGLRVAALTDQLRAFAGKPRVVRRRVDLSQLVIEISERLEGEVRGRATVSYELPGDLPHVCVDSALMRRVALDLVRNAVDALGGGAGAIRVRTRLVEADAAALEDVQPPDVLEPGRYVALEVHDTGCGMDEATRSRSLDPFFSTKSPGRGLGLGEALGLVSAQGGGIRVESEPGRGTTVRVLLQALEPLWRRGTRPRAPAR
jgi:PAS domain S-box-containing protein